METETISILLEKELLREIDEAAKDEEHIRVKHEADCHFLRRTS